MRVRRTFRMHNPRADNYSSMEFAVELDSLELGYEVTDENFQEVYQRMSLEAEEMLRKDIRRYVEEGQKK